VSAHTGGVPDANAIPIGKSEADKAMDFASCIGCGSCVAACKNSSAMLFTAAKIAQLAYLPQGQYERKKRALAMVAQMDKEGFGGCTNLYECEAVCPKGITIDSIALMNRDYLKAVLTEAPAKQASGS
jgi:succinate dehydrogenase / fumarate reductase, iron-sulfur subunit